MIMLCFQYGYEQHKQTTNYPPPNCSPAQLLINDKLRHSSGFTIIEVALVLAIAGLIFLVVFIAWPALQNSQADTARRQDVGRVVSALESYKVDNQGDLSSLGVPGSDAKTYSVPGSAGFYATVGKLSQTTQLEVYASDKTFGNGDANWLKHYGKGHMIGIALGQTCGSGSSGYNANASSADASVYAILSSGTVYCVMM
ncbi:MAG: type II secretion system protein [Candidatus Nanoperiomorbaceae bacterium]